jgi:hypothetical protein
MQGHTCITLPPLLLVLLTVQAAASHMRNPGAWRLWLLLLLLGCRRRHLPHLQQWPN